MYDKKEHTKLFFDIETTGLDPQNNDVLEIGAILVDKDLNMVSIFHGLVIGQNHDAADDYVKKMHEKSGLWEDLHHLTAPMANLGVPFFSSFAVREVVERELVDWVAKMGCKPNAIVLHGESIHFDKGMMAAQFPLFHWLLHYRMRDYSAQIQEWKEADIAFPKFGTLADNGGDIILPENHAFLTAEHRGIADAYSSLQVARFIRKNLLILSTALKNTTEEFKAELAGVKQKHEAAVCRVCERSEGNHSPEAHAFDPDTGIPQWSEGMPTMEAK